MNEPSQFPVVVQCHARFVVVVPGAPYPIEVISSGEGTGDLVGFYSLRQAGLGKVIARRKSDDTKDPLIMTIRDLLGGHAGDDGIASAITSIDYWIDSKLERDNLISLIFDVGDTEISDWTVREFDTELRHQLRLVGDAHERNATDEIKYLGQMFAAFLTQLNHKAQERNKRRRRRSRMLLNLVLAYVVIGLTVGGSVWLRDAGLLDWLFHLARK